MCLCVLVPVGLGFFCVCVQGMLEEVKIAFPEVIVFKVISCHEPPPTSAPVILCFFLEGLTYKKIHPSEGKCGKNKSTNQFQAGVRHFKAGD